MQNGDNNLNPKPEYLCLENIQDLYGLQGATCTGWANKFIYKKGANEGDYIIYAVCENNLNKIYFNKIDFKIIRKAYLVIRIYFGNDFANLICDNQDNNKSILIKINSSSIMQKYILDKLNIKQYSINQFIIKDFKAVVDGFDKIFKLELIQIFNDNNINNLNQMKAKTDVNTKLVLNINKSFNNINGQNYLYNNSNKVNNNNKYNNNQKNNNPNFNLNQNNLKKNPNSMPSNPQQMKQFQPIQNNIQQTQVNLQQIQVKLQQMQVNLQQMQKNTDQMQLLQQMQKLQQIQTDLQQILIHLQQMHTNLQQMQTNPQLQAFLPQIQAYMLQIQKLQQMQQMNQILIQNIFNFLMNQMNSQNNFQIQNMQNNGLININNPSNNSQMYSNEMLNKSIRLLELHSLKGKEYYYFPKKGLNNVGLTCYMNSILQCLLHIPELNYFFSNLYNEFKNTHYDIIKKTESKGKLSEEYKKVLDGVISEEKSGNFFARIISDSFSPSAFNNLICRLNPQFAKYESNDARDLIIYLLQEIHEELNYNGGKKLDKIPSCNQLNEDDAFRFFYKVNSELNFSIISYLFWGIVKQTTICSQCHKQLYNFQYFQYLSFSLYNYTNIRFNFYRGLKDYTKPEILQGDNQFYCQFCRGLRNATVESKIFYPSPYLLINLDYGKDKKYNPKEIDFGSTVCITKEFLNNNIPEAYYDLVAVSTHIGSSGNTGHYIAFCKDPSDEEIWHKFNDSSHSLCKFEETYKYSPYLLIFKKKNNFK